ncbi:hypothetical protein N7490_006646 [Penicillium lividum]|nr:hypothetical protein N7490_006646 [Penicillium lividum]
MDPTVSVSQWKGEKLKNSSHWPAWYSAMKQFAKTRKVWDYCNPEKPAPEVLEEPQAPARPRLHIPRGATTEVAKTLREEFKDRQMEYSYDHDDYKEELKRYEKVENGLQSVEFVITASTDTKLHRLMDDLETPYEKISFLKKRFSHTKSHQNEVLLRWAEGCVRPPNKGQNVLSWLEEWELIRDEAVNQKVESDTAQHPQLFLHAVKDILPVWWEARFQDIVLRSNTIEINDLIESFRTSYTMSYSETTKKNINSTSKAAFATSTWQGKTEAETSRTDRKDGKTGPFQDRSYCPCGMKHPVTRCWVLNEDQRPDGWMGLRKASEALKKSFKKEPEWKVWAENQLKNASNSYESTEKTSESANLAHVGFATVALSTEVDTKYRDQWVLDTGASVHVCNDRTKFTEYKEDPSYLRTGDNRTAIAGVGTATFTGRDPTTGRPRVVNLYNCRYSPDFHCNLVSLGRIEDHGGWWDMKHGRIMIGDQPILETYREHDIYLFSQTRDDLCTTTIKTQNNTQHKAALATRRSEKPLKSSANTNTWHKRLGHQLPKLVSGVEVVRSTEDGEERPDDEICTVCSLVNAPRQVSRRPIGKHYGRCGRVYFDLIQVIMGYNQHCWITHFYVEGIRFHWLMTHVNKNGCQEAIRSFIAFAIRWLNLPIKVFHSDNERSVDESILLLIKQLGCVHTFTVPYTPEMNGPGERAGGVIILRARALLKEGKLPDKLWPEAVKAAVYLLNRTPTRLEDGTWIVPWDEARRFIGFNQGTEGTPVNTPTKTSLANVKLYGSLAYCRIPNIPKLDKMKSRAEIGYLVGYVASNIWQIWIPHRGQVRMVRDAVFDKNRRFSAENHDPDEGVKLPVPEDYPPTIMEEGLEIDCIRQGLDEQTTRTSTAESTPEGSSPGRSYRVRDADDVDVIQDQGSGRSREPQETTIPHSGLNQVFMHKNPIDHTPPPDYPVSSNSAETTTDQGVRDDPERDAQDHNQIDQTPVSPVSLREPSPEDQLQDQLQSSLQDGSEREDRPTSAENSLPGVFPEDQDRDRAALDTSNIIHGPRVRRSRQDRDYAYKTMVIDDNNDDDTTAATLQAFATGLLAPKPSLRQHRDDLPPPPQRFRDVWKHPLSEEFSRAMRVELDGLQAKETYKVVEKPKDRGIQVLPLMWVYAYKFDQDGFLIKCKARICWFLGIRILRNRKERKLWLVQDSYFASVAERFNLAHRAPVRTPGTTETLEPYDGQATAESIHQYQQRVGSVQYGTTITRADAAKRASICAQFLTNPGPKHHQAIERLICYLYTTRFWAIQYGPVDGDSEVVKFSSDASYGDMGDRTSSAGYICQFFGGPVDWRATKQKTVTTSTTEAELLGLSDAGRSLQWWDRLFGRIGFKYPEGLTIECDNRRTVDLINAEDTPFDTKLRHVDIHGHWLRQEVKEGRVRIKWVPTSQMLADGLTKMLPRQKHEAFVRMLGLTDVRHLIEEEK